MAKLLLVEDDNNLREIYEARLQAEGYTIVSAKDGEEALVVAKEEKPDLIISDVMMPKISGFEMLDILRNTEGLKDTKIIMLTALGQSEDQTRANSLGADRYLVKSQVTLEDIVQVAHELLNPQTPSEVETVAVPTSGEPAETDTTVPASSPEPSSDEPVQQPQLDDTQPVTAPSVTSQPTDTLSATDIQTPADQPVAVPDINISTDGQLSMQSEAEEQASVNQQINNFVGNNASDQIEPSAVPQTLPNDTANDQTLANAVNNLSGQSQTIPVSNPSVTDSPSITTTHHQKVIKPIDDVTPPKKSLDELLAQEDTRNSQNENPKSENAFNPDDPNNIAL